MAKVIFQDYSIYCIFTVAIAIVEWKIKKLLRNFEGSNGSILRKLWEFTVDVVSDKNRGYDTQEIMYEDLTKLRRFTWIYLKFTLDLPRIYPDLPWIYPELPRNYPGFTPNLLWSSKKQMYQINYYTLFL